MVIIKLLIIEKQNEMQKIHSMSCIHAALSHRGQSSEGMGFVCPFIALIYNCELPESIKLLFLLQKHLILCIVNTTKFCRCLSIWIYIALKLSLNVSLHGKEAYSFVYKNIILFILIQQVIHGLIFTIKGSQSTEIE